MNKQFERLQSLLPERGGPGSNTWYQNPKALRDWLGNLPLTNQNLTAQQLLGVLRETNEVRMDPLRRFDALELLRAPVREVVDRLGAQLTSDSFPMPESRMRFSDTILEFQRELTTGYIAVICDICLPSGAVPFLRGKTVATALSRAVTHQGNRLWIAYQTHSVPQVGVWQSLHDLFLLAVELGLEDKADADPQLKGAKTSVRASYVQALLHAFAKPYHFIQKENAELRSALPVLASLCTIAPGYAPEGAIAVCTDGDATPPGPVRGRHVAVESLWQLDVAAVLRAFDAEIERRGTDAISVTIQGSNGARAELSVEMVERLTKTWRGRRERAYPRSIEEATVDALIGMQAVHHVLAGDTDFDSFQRRARVRTASEDAEEPNAIFAQAGAAVAPARAQVIDRSIGGFRLRFERTEDVRARVGEVIALAPNDGDGRAWCVGLVRWLRVDAFGTVEVGVETLGRDPRAVSIASLDIRGMARPPMRGIFVVPTKADESGKLDPYVLAPILFGRDAIAVEVAALDPSSADGSRVEKINDMRIRASGGVYLAVVLPALGADATDAANDAALAKLIAFPRKAG